MIEEQITIPFVVNYIESANLGFIEKQDSCCKFITLNIINRIEPIYNTLDEEQKEKLIELNNKLELELYG